MFYLPKQSGISQWKHPFCFILPQTHSLSEWKTQTDLEAEKATGNFLLPLQLHNFELNFWNILDFQLPSLKWTCISFHLELWKIKCGNI